MSEAKILGVPSVVSYAGGTTDRIKHGVSGFYYQTDAPYMLAHYICKVFEDTKVALRFSENYRKEIKPIIDVKEDYRRPNSNYVIVKFVGIKK